MKAQHPTPARSCALSASLALFAAVSACSAPPADEAHPQGTGGSIAPATGGALATGGTVNATGGSVSATGGTTGSGGEAPQTAWQLVWSDEFDGEGLPTRRTALVQDGVLESYLLDTYSARKLGRASTHHASRDGAGVSVGTTNLMLLPGAETPESLIRSVRSGLYVTELIGQGVNSVTGTSKPLRSTISRSWA